MGPEGPCPSCGVALPETFAASPEEPGAVLLAWERRTVPWFLGGIELHRTEPDSKPPTSEKGTFFVCSWGWIAASGLHTAVLST